MSKRLRGNELDQSVMFQDPEAIMRAQRQVGRCSSRAAPRTKEYECVRIAARWQPAPLMQAKRNDHPQKSAPFSKAATPAEGFQEPSTSDGPDASERVSDSKNL